MAFGAVASSLPPQYVASASIVMPGLEDSAGSRRIVVSEEAVQGWSAGSFAAALRHDQSCPAFNRHFRQLLHVGYKAAAELGPRYLDAVRRNESAIAGSVTANLFDRHLKPIFIG